MTAFNLPLSVNSVKGLMQTLAGLNPEEEEEHARALKNKLGRGIRWRGAFGNFLSWWRRR